MIQRHSIILWRKAEREDKSFEETAREAYEVLTLLQDYPQELRPNYLTAKTKKDIREFDWNYENFRNILKKGINKEGENVFKDLGYSVSFFSSMNEENSAAFSMTVGNKFEKVYNTLVIDLPLSVNLYDKKTAEMTGNLFRRLAQLYMPFWGCISNKALSRRYGKYLEGNLPTTVHWMNYWSEDIIHAVGMEKIQKSIEGNQEIAFKNGILSIKDTALDADKEDDIRFHDELQKKLLGGTIHGCNHLPDCQGKQSQ